MCGAEASALTPLLVIRPGCGLNWLVHRHQHLQARVQRSLASAGGRLSTVPDASVDSPGATKNTSSLRASVAEALRENPDRDQSTSSSLSGTSRVSPTYLHKGKRRLTSKGQCRPVQAAQREAGEGRFEHVTNCDSPLWATFGHAMLACSGSANARSRTTLLSS